MTRSRERLCSTPGDRGGFDAGDSPFFPSPRSVGSFWALGPGGGVSGAGAWVSGAGAWVFGASAWVFGAGAWVCRAPDWASWSYAGVSRDRALVRGVPAAWSHGLSGWIPVPGMGRSAAVEGGQAGTASHWARLAGRAG
jgi:hypothetical protein